MSSWKKFRFRLEAAGCRLLAWWIPKLSRDFCVRMANGLGEIGFLLDHKGRAVALANVECAFGPDIPPARRREIARASYRNFVRTMVDLFWTPALARPENRHWLRTEGWEPIRKRLQDEKRGGMLLTLHYGNWEWASIACAWEGYSTLAVAEKFKNPLLDEIFLKNRQLSGQRIIPQEKSMLRMLREVKRGGGTSFLADLTVPPEQASAVIRAFALEMCVSILHGVLAVRGGALVVPSVCVPEPDGHVVWRVFAPLDLPADATPATVAQLCWDCYEPIIRANPGLWLWSYKHFRYRPRDAKVAYPFYANEWCLFDELRSNAGGDRNSG
jgi:KDO2-lipid IV(A) lauroyltransferase